MKITSEKKIAAARANGARSRGPVTPEGKARSSRNALRHGLRSQMVGLPTESSEALHPLLDSYLRRLAPRSRTEQAIVGKLVLAESRHRRALMLEKEILDSAMSSVPGCGSVLDRLTAAFSQLSATGRLDTVYRYQVRYSNLSHRLLLHYLALRTKEPITPLPATPVLDASASRSLAPNENRGSTNEPKTPFACNKFEPVRHCLPHGGTLNSVF
jgi:hypothetical protein